MSQIKTLEILTKLANQLDEHGKGKLADFVDLMAVKFASEDLKPVGQIYQKDGKYFQKFYDERKGVIIKEVDQAGNILPPAPPAEPSFFEKYNPFAGLVSALGGDADAAEQEQMKSQVPWIKSVSEK